LHHHRQRQLQQFGEYYAGREVVFTHSQAFKPISH
jgi:hypothetical protein